MLALPAFECDRAACFDRSAVCVIQLHFLSDHTGVRADFVRSSGLRLRGVLLPQRAPRSLCIVFGDLLLGCDAPIASNVERGI